MPTRILAGLACLLELTRAETEGLCLLSRRTATSRLDPAAPLCTSSCSEGCFAIPYSHQDVSDAQCALCASGQSWWPCNVENLCSCGQVVAETCVKSGEAPSSASWTDSDCLKCGAAINSQRWPCDQANACTCVGLGSEPTIDVSTSEIPDTVAPDPDPDVDASAILAAPPCATSCSDGCFAIPHSHQAVTDAHCAPCATGQTWWPCNVENLCSCGQTVAEACAKSSDAPSSASWTDSDCLICGVAINSQRWPCDQANACTCIRQGSDPTIDVSTSEIPKTAPDTVPDGLAGTLQLDAWEVPTSESGQIATLNTHNGPYDLPNVNTCFHDKYSDIVTEGDENWVSIENWKAFGTRQPVTRTVPERVPLDGTSVTSRDVNVATLSVSEGGVEKTIKAAIGFGHGVANLKCGDCFIVKTSGTRLLAGSWIFKDSNFEELIAYDKETRYAVIRTVDIATWSLEISDPALYYTIPLTGRNDHSTTPDYQPVDCAAVMSASQE